MPMLLAAALLLFAGADDLFDAARKGDAAGVKAALDAGAPVDSKWRYDQTALFIAAFRGHADVVKVLLDRGADPNARDSFYKMSALAAATQKNPAVAVMLAAKGAKDRDVLLLRSAASGRNALLEPLLTGGIQWPPELLSQALLAAEAKKQTAAAELLRKAGAQPLPKAPVDPAALAAMPGSYTATGAGGPITVNLTADVESGIITMSVPNQSFDYRPVDAATFVSLTQPATHKLLVERDSATGKPAKIQFVTETMNLQFTPTPAAAAKEPSSK